MSFLSQPIQSILIKPKRQIDDFLVLVSISESTNDTLTITKQPVQQGAAITDHAYKEPTVFTMSAHFSDQGFTDLFSGGQNSLADTYQKLLDLQNKRIPFDVVTPKRIYKQVLMAGLGQTTDGKTENILALNFTFQEIIIVSIGTVTTSRTSQKNPAKTGATQNKGKQSAGVTLFQPKTTFSGGP